MQYGIDTYGLWIQTPLKNKVIKVTVNVRQGTMVNEAVLLCGIIVSAVLRPLFLLSSDISFCSRWERNKKKPRLSIPSHRQVTATFQAKTHLLSDPGGTYSSAVYFCCCDYADKVLSYFSASSA